MASSLAVAASTSVQAATSIEVVKPSSLGNWYLGGDGTQAAGVGTFVAGPGSAPAGTGSLQMALNDALQGYVAALPNAVPGQTRLDELETLSYSTYRSAGSSASWQIALQFNADYDVTDAADVWQGRLVYEPYNTVGNINAGEWNTWDALAANGRWWGTGTNILTNSPMVGGVRVAQPCTIGSPCTFTQLLAAFPDVGFRGTDNVLLLKAGANWNGFVGSVDNLQVGLAGSITTYDFEPETACTTTCYVNGATGNNAFGGDTPASAKATIQAAVTQVNVGGMVVVASGTYLEDVTVNKAGVTLQGAGAAFTTISGPIGGGNATVRISAGNVTVDGFTITREGNNPSDWNNANGALNGSGVAIQSQGNFGTVTNNVIYGNRTGIDINNSDGNTITDNVIADNRTGMIFRNRTDNTTVTGNLITDNWSLGILFLDASGGSNSPVQSAANSDFTRNDLSGNWYGAVVDRQTGGSLPAPGDNPKNFTCNWWGATPPTVANTPSVEPGYPALVPPAYGGTSVNPGDQPDILGEASANILYTPYLISDDLDGSCEAIGQGDQPADAEGDEGDTLNASGSFTGTDITVTKTAGPGTLVDNGDGSWDWSYDTTDDGVDSVEVTGEDAYGGTATQDFSIEVANVAPTADFHAPATVNGGFNFDISLDNVFDPSADDTTAGFEYAFDCGSGFGAFGSDASATCTAPLGGSVDVQGAVRDKDGGTSTYLATVDVLAAQAGKLAVIASLEALLTGVKKDDKDFEKAIKEVEKSLNDKHWEDDETPADKGGNKIFDGEKKAVQALMKIKDPTPEVLAAIDILWNIDRVLAETAVADAIDRGGDSQRITKALDELAKAADEVAKGNFDKAIDRYKKAWQEATKA